MVTVTVTPKVTVTHPDHPDRKIEWEQGSIWCRLYYDAIEGIPNVHQWRYIGPVQSMDWSMDNLPDDGQAIAFMAEVITEDANWI